jgi:ribonuclease HII
MMNAAAGVISLDPLIAGIDEVGRGPLAGPVLAAAVILNQPVDGIADSKVLTPARRAALAVAIRGSARIGIGAASVIEIDRINILQATFLAMRRAVARLDIVPSRLLVDGNRAPEFGISTLCIVGGDAIEPSIGAASIIAKVARDALMARLARRYPQYGWERNAGYGTPEHLTAMRSAGLTPHHRRSFAPARQPAGDIIP